MDNSSNKQRKVQVDQALELALAGAFKALLWVLAVFPEEARAVASVEISEGALLESLEVAFLVALLKAPGGAEEWAEDQVEALGKKYLEAFEDLQFAEVLGQTMEEGIPEAPVEEILEDFQAVVKGEVTILVQAHSTLAALWALPRQAPVQDWA